jgi:transposase-like protein
VVVEKQGRWCGGRTLAEFQKEFPDEATCAAFLYARRWPDGFVCPACGKGRAVALKSRPRLFECLDCGRQTSLTAGTAMHRSKLPLTTWFWAAHVMATHSNGMSARQLEDQLGVAGGVGATEPVIFDVGAPDRPWMELLYGKGYLPFYTDGAALHPPRPGEWQNIRSSFIVPGRIGYQD